MDTPFLYSISQNGTFARKKNGATSLKLWHAIQLDSAKNMGWVPSGHTFSSLCLRLKISKVVL